MEALGVASSIAGLISLADVLAFKISKYYSLVKGAHSDIRDLLMEIQSLYGVLNSLKLLTTCLEADKPPAYTETAALPQLDHFQTCRQNLDLLSRSLNKFDLDSAKPLASAKIKLLWPFKSTETKEIIEKMGRNKRDLADALTADGLTALVTALSSQKRIEETVEDVQMRLQRLAEEKAENELDEFKRKVFDWCSTVNPYQKHRNAKSLRHPNTVLWFFDCPEYRKWVDEPRSAIWLYGIPGAGKTILTSAVIEEAKLLVSKRPQHAVAYYYCEFKLPETQLLSNILGSLIRQIAASSGEAFEELETFYTERNEKAKHPILPSTEDLTNLLKRLSRCFECVMVVIDALDECTDPQERSSILQALSTLNDERGNCKVVYTSRDEIDIRRNLSEYDSISIAARGKDLELYVAAVIEERVKNRTLRLKDPALRGIIIHGIVSKANGMFQWAKCQLDHLCLLSTDKERRKALETLPKDLFETYRRILDRVNSSTVGNQRLVEKTLRWIVFSQRRLTAQTITTAVAVEIGSDFLDPDDVPDVDSILWWCSSLVTQDKATGELSLSHFTVEEFLSDSKILDSESLRCFHMDVNDDLPLSAPQPRKPHSILAKVCLTYLHFEEFSSLGLKPWKQLKKDLDDNEFLKYCGEFWPKHAECREFDEELFDLMCRLFDPVKSRTFMLWLQIYWYGLDDDYERSVPKAASTLHLAACLRFTKICEWLVVEKNVDVNFHDAVLGTPIICAMTTLTYRDVSPSVPILRLLLKHGAKADVVLIEGRDRSEKREAKNGMVLISPMSLALDCADRQPKECSNVFRELLNSNQISPLTDSFFWSPPPPIIQPPHGTEPPPGTQPENNTFETMITLFKYILNHPSATSMDEESRTKMLSYIAKHTKEISDKEIVIRYTREELFSSQMATQDLAMSAAQNGQTQLIKTLIEKGSDPKALSDCLSLAARHGAADMVDILLNYCPWDVPYILSKIQTAWINAAIFGKVEVLKTFQKYGIDPKVVVRSDILPSKDALREGTALTYAILNGMIEAVKFLAAIPETDFGIRAEGRNLLHFTAQAPHHRPEMVALMLSKGLDPLDRSSSGGSILHYLLGNRYELGSEDLKIIQSILGAGGDIYAVDHHETSLLHVLFERTDLQSIPILNDFVNIIIGDSRMISKPRKDGVLPLQLAIRSRQPSSIIQMLLPKDLSLWNSPEDRKFGPIHEAVKVVTTSRQTSRRPPPPLGRLGLVPIIDDELHVLRILDILLEVPGVITNVSDENGNTPLLTIAGSIGQYAPLPSPERAQIIKKLLENGCDVNHRNDKGWTAVHFLANVAYVDGLREILKFSPDLSYQNADGDTALHLAVFLHRHGEKESDRIALRKLLDYAASKDQKSSLQLMNKRGYLPLHLACQNQYEGLFQMFHDSGNIPNINVRTKNEETPLILAAMQDHTRPIIRTLLRLGAEINSQDFAKQTALHHAAAQGLIDSVKMLAEHGASCTITDENGYQPWVLAAVDDYDETAEWLKHRAEDEIASSVEPGSAPKMPEIRDGELDQEASNKANHNSGPETSDSPNTKIGGSAMLKAIDDGKESLVQALLKMGSNPNEHLGRAQRTPLHIASALGSSVIVRSLIKHGANIEGKDKYGNTPLHLAASDGRDANIRILVKAGAKLDARDNLMKTPLHWTAIEGELYAAKAIMELAEKGEVAPVSPASNSSFASRSNTDNFKGGYFGQAPEDPNQDTDGDSNDKSSTGEPPQGRHPSLPVNEVDFRTAGSYLLEMRNSDRETPLLSALCSDRLDVAKYLVEKGANVHFQDRAGCNALWHAVFLADKELIETFLSRGVRVESATYSGFSPLHVAIDRGFAKQEETTEIARILIKAGANLSSNNRGKVSPLHCACHIGNLTIAKELLALSSEGEDRVESAFYGTPVYAASFRGHLEVVKLLLERGVDVNAGMRGESPLEAAILEGHEEVAALLEEHGAVRTKEVGGSGSIGREDPDPSERRRNVERYLIHTASALSIDVPE